MSPRILKASEIPELIRPFARAIENKPDYALRLARFCVALREKVDPTEMARFALKVRELEPNHPLVLKHTAVILSEQVPAWHFGCLDDSARNHAYETALSKLVNEDSIVLDVGAGCGILSLFAARAGAQHVYAVEIEPLMAEKAADIIKLNGYSDKITLINKDILDVKLGVDIPTKCNFVVQDIIWPNPLSRKIHELLAHCRAELLTDDAVFCPEKIIQHGLLHGTDPEINWPDYGDFFGFDLSPLNLLQHRYGTLSPLYSLKNPLTSPFIFSELDLTRSHEIKDAQWSETVRATGEGHIRYFLEWLEFIFPDGTRLENAPDQKSVRSVLTHRLLNPVPVTVSDILDLLFELQDGAITMTIKSAG